MRRYGDVVTVICDAKYGMPYIKTQNIWIYQTILKTVVHLSNYDNFVSGIICCVCLYTHKSQLIVMDN